MSMAVVPTSLSMAIKIHLSIVWEKMQPRPELFATNLYNRDQEDSYGMVDGGLLYGDAPRSAREEYLGDVIGDSSRMASIGKSAIAPKMDAMDQQVSSLRIIY